jgi:hypothetical protein
MIPVTFMHPPARHSSRLGQRFQLALGAAAALAAISLSPGSAQAYVVTVNSVQYDVTTFTGSYDADTSKFETAANGGVMPWWGSESLASQFAAAVSGNLGAPNDPFGPYFGWSAMNGAIEVKRWFTTTSTVVPGAHMTDVTFTWAQATLYTAPAPGPLPLFGAAAAFGFSRKLRKRIKLAPAALGSSLPQA